jgi:hypothetical protein
LPEASVKDALAATVFELGDAPVYTAEMVVVPLLTPVARPLESILATKTSLDCQVTCVVRSCVIGALLKVPMARYWTVSPILPIVWLAGITTIELSARAGAGLVKETVTFDEPESRPFCPVPVAVIVEVPDPTAVTRPAALTVATEVLDELHETEFVMFSVVTGCLPCW